MKVSIIIPAYNEEKRIGKTLRAYSEYFEYLRKGKVIDYEILVVINATKDNTLNIVKDFSKQNKRINYLNLVKGGKGYAIIEGFKNSLGRQNDLIGFVDADMATSPEEYYNLIRNIGNYKGIIASRYLKDSIVNPKQSLQRVISSRLFNFFIRGLMFLPYRDTQCGAKLFKKEELKKVLQNINFSKWAFDVDLLYNFRKMGFSIKELPTKWSDKKYSTINFKKAGPLMGLAVIRLRLLNSSLKSTVGLYDKTINLLR